MYPWTEETLEETSQTSQSSQDVYSGSGQNTAISSDHQLKGKAFLTRGLNKVDGQPSKFIIFIRRPTTADVGSNVNREINEMLTVTCQMRNLFTVKSKTSGQNWFKRQESNSIRLIANVAVTIMLSLVALRCVALRCVALRYPSPP